MAFKGPSSTTFVGHAGNTGMWHTLLDHSDDGSYLESSATAGFAYMAA